MAIRKVDHELQIVYGEVYAPEFPDSQGDYMSRETIREMAFEFNIERAAAANNEASNTGPGGLRQTIIDLIAEYSRFTRDNAIAYFNQMIGDIRNPRRYAAWMVPVVSARVP